MKVDKALKVDKLETPLLRKCPLNVLVHLLESSSLSTPVVPKLFIVPYPFKHSTSSCVPPLAPGSAHSQMLCFASFTLGFIRTASNSKKQYFWLWSGLHGTMTLYTGGSQTSYSPVPLQTFNLQLHAPSSTRVSTPSNVVFCHHCKTKLNIYIT